LPDGKAAGPQTAVETGALWTLLVWTLVLAILQPLYADPDLWGHLRFGLDALRDRTLTTVDPYSFTQDVPWVNHEWLSELNMAIAYWSGGTMGLVILKFLLLAVAFGVLARSLSVVPLIPRVGVIFVVMWAVAPIARFLRPQNWSVACAALLAMLLCQPAPSRRLAWIPVVLLVWVNVHGGWIVGGLMLAVWSIVKAFDPVWRAWAIGLAVTSALATLVNPYGAGLWLFLVETVRIGRDAQEWQPLTAAPVVDWWPWAATAALVIAVIARRRRLAVERLVTVILLGYLSFRVVRLVPFFAIVTTIYAAAALAETTSQSRLWAWRPTAPSRFARSLLVVPILVCVWIFPPVAGSCIPVRGYWVPEPMTAAALQRAKPHGKLVTEFGWGEYAIWHFGPALRVSMDGRRETVYSVDTLTQSDAVVAGEPNAMGFLLTTRPEYVWLTSARTRTRQWLMDHGYRIDIDIPGKAWLAVRSDVGVVTMPRVGAPSCFPG
jgi:hypothetical protein